MSGRRFSQVPKLSIITPTLLRESLIRTCESIDAQDYDYWEHIIMIDTDEDNPELLKKIEHPRRRIYRCHEPHKNFGNTCRHNAWLKCRGDYIGYIDDDDYFVRGAFGKIANALANRRPDAIVYPAHRHGERFFNVPPASCMTVTGQYFHRHYAKGRIIRWPRVKIGDQGYLHDGTFIESIKKITEFTPICEDHLLVVIEESSNGKI
jgi:glycosyltransferase involved in cell wall biosynthesis